MTLPPLTLVIGGARSGKSRLAEGLVSATGRKRHYIATAEIWDDEMRDRIAQHQADRGTDWQTWTTPLDVDLHPRGNPSGRGGSAGLRDTLADQSPAGGLRYRGQIGRPARGT